MPLHIDLQNTGDAGARAETAAAIEHALADRPGEWQVSIVGSRATDNWEMKIQGPRGFERSLYVGRGSGRVSTGCDSKFVAQTSANVFHLKICRTTTPMVSCRSTLSLPGIRL